MQGLLVPVAINIDAALAANAQGQFTLPRAMSLWEVSLCNSVDSDMILTVGTSADADGIITAATGGDSGTPLVIEPASFDGALCDQEAAYHMANDTVFTWSLDFDGDGGTAAEDLMLIFWFTEG